MVITVEISLYPLTSSFGTLIIDFVKKLRNQRDLEIKTNTMSTQIRGPYERVMKVITADLKQIMESEHRVSVILKIFNEGLDLTWIDIE